MELRARLRQLGHTAEDAGDELAGLLRAYQRFHGLPASGEVCPRTFAHLSSPRCQHPDVMALGGLSRWTVPSVTYVAAIGQTPAFSPERLAEVLAGAAAQVEGACGLRVDPAPDPTDAQVVTTTTDLGSGTLGLTDLPAGQARCLLRLTTEPTLTDAEVPCTALHEFLHSLGLGHSSPASDPDSVMNPVYNGITSLGAWDVAELRARYGPPAVAPPPPAATPPPPAAPTWSGHLGAGDTPFTIHADSPGDYTVTVTHSDPTQGATPVPPTPTPTAPTDSAETLVEHLRDLLGYLPGEVSRNVDLTRLAAIVEQGLAAGRGVEPILEAVLSAGTVLFPDVAYAAMAERILARVLHLVVAAKAA